MPSYNGWTNYETWVVKLWMDNDQGDYLYWQDRTQECWKEARDKHPNQFMNRQENAQQLLADALKDHHEELQGGIAAINGTVFANLLNAAMGEVNWHEIATNLLDDVEAD